MLSHNMKHFNIYITCVNKYEWRVLAFPYQMHVKFAESQVLNIITLYYLYVMDPYYKYELSKNNKLLSAFICAQF
jgi:hypothetical protein